MKENQKSLKRLALKKSTIAHLQENEMRILRAGSGNTYTLTCFTACGTCPTGGGTSRNYCAE